MCDLHAFGKHVVLTMQNKPAIAIHRAADMDRVVGAEPRRADLQLFIEITKVEPRRRLVDYQTHGGFRVMVTHQDDGPFKPFVTDMRAGDKKMTLKRGQRMQITATLWWRLHLFAGFPMLRHIIP
jgi:hypothetical protein